MTLESSLKQQPKFERMYWNKIAITVTEKGEVLALYDAGIIPAEYNNI